MAGQLAHSSQDLYPKTFLFALLLSIHGHRRRSLKFSGAIAANLIGYLTLANPNPIFGVALLSFYTVGTIATKYKKIVKASLVDESDLSPSDKLQGDRADIHAGRDWKQVLCNAWYGTACAILYRIIQLGVLSSLDIIGAKSILISKSLVSSALAFWAGCAGDTLASELGILSRSKPRLITSLKEVPPGTNGAISLSGLAFSTLGGLVVGAACALMGNSHQNTRNLVIQCGVFGLLGSTIDSLLGATLQQTLYSKAENRVVSRRETQLGGTREVIIISGRDLLTNNQVNLVSSTCTGICAGILTYYSIIS